MNRQHIASELLQAAKEVTASSGSQRITAETTPLKVVEVIVKLHIDPSQHRNVKSAATDAVEEAIWDHDKMGYGGIYPQSVGNPKIKGNA